jgi:hypothetical protein
VSCLEGYLAITIVGKIKSNYINNGKELQGDSYKKKRGRAALSFQKTDSGDVYSVTTML